MGHGSMGFTSDRSHGGWRSRIKGLHKRTWVLTEPHRSGVLNDPSCLSGLLEERISPPSKDRFRVQLTSSDPAPISHPPHSPGWAVSGHDGSRECGMLDRPAPWDRTVPRPAEAAVLLLSRGGRVGAAPGGRGQVQRQGRSCQRRDAPGRGWGGTRWAPWSCSRR